jgi:hypothetical protein
MLLLLKLLLCMQQHDSKLPRKHACLMFIDTYVGRCKHHVLQAVYAARPC